MGRAGYVLTGGASVRMGRDKALLGYRGGTLVEWVAARVLEAAGSVTLVGGAERYRGLGFRAIDDPLPGLGPLAGLAAALRDTGAEWNLVAACDMPLLDAARLAGLLERGESSAAQAVVPRGRNGLAQPLCAAYHRSALPAVEEALAARRLRLRDVLAALRVEYCDACGEEWLANANTPGEWEKFEESVRP